MTEARPHAILGRLPTLSINGLSIEFGRHSGVTRVVCDVGLEVWPGEIVGLIGESGSGKTLTALSALRMLPKRARIVSGVVKLGSTALFDLSEKEMRAIRGERMALIPQDALQALNPTMRIGRQVGESLELHRGMSVRAASSAAVKLLASVRMPQPALRARDYPHQFSGGMQQRAMIAMGLALKPDLLIADEPTTALDVTVQAQVLKLLREIRDSSGASILFITHDLGIVAQLCDWVYVMREGEVVETAAAVDIFTAPQADYTRMLLAATPRVTSPGPLGADR